MKVQIKFNLVFSLFMKTLRSFYYAGSTWNVQKHAMFGNSRAVKYDLYLGAAYVEGVLTYCMKLSDLSTNKLIDVKITRSLMDVSDEYLNLLCCYA